MLSLHAKSVILLCLICAFPICSQASVDGGLLSYFSATELSDSLALYASLYNPAENSTDSIYGSGPMFGIQYKMGISAIMGLNASISVFQKNGNPFNDNTFTGEDIPSRLTFIPVEINYIIDLILNKPETGNRIRNLYIGGGVNHVWARERAPGAKLAKGSAFGGQVSAGAIFFISRHIAWGLEVKYLTNRPLMKLAGNSDYRTELDGMQVQAMFVWNLK